MTDAIATLIDIVLVVMVTGGVLLVCWCMREIWRSRN